MARSKEDMEKTTDHEKSNTGEDTRMCQSLA